MSSLGIATGQDSSGDGIYAQRYNSAGATLGSEFRVNTYTTSFQFNPAIATDSSGNFVVTWQSTGQDGSGYGIYAQRYNSAGVPQGSEFQVNTYTTNSQRNPAIATDSIGNFVVTWQSTGQDVSGYGIYAQRYNSAGVPQGSEFQVNTYTTNNQGNPAIATDSSGNFVVTWQSTGQDVSGYGIYTQRYNSAGVPQGSEFQVNTYTTNNQGNPAIATDSSGNFVVTWQSTGQDGSSYGIYTQRYNSVGVPQGSEFRVNTYTTNNQGNPAIATDSSGNFVVTWQSNGQDGSSYGVYAQRYNSVGVPQGSEFRVNTYTTNIQVFPAIATDSSGNFVVTWQSNGQDSSGFGIYAQRYSDATLSLSITPNTFSEAAGAGAATGTVSLGTITGSPLVVALTSSDTTEATVPTTVTIPGGSASATFPVNAVDDLIADGTQPVVITATATSIDNLSFNTAFAGLAVTDNEISPITGTSGADSLLGATSADSILGLAGADTINGGAGNDTINGGLDRDVLTGGTGADLFVYAAGDSLVAASDRIPDFNSPQGDRFQLGTLPTALYNVQTIRAATVSAAAVLAYADKNGSAAGTTPLGVGEAVLFGVQGRAFLSYNSGTAAFEPGTDLVVEVTNIVYDSPTPPLGALTVSNYFV